MKILAIETSCDETAAAVTEGNQILSSVKITQEAHSQWGGVVPSLAKRDHERNIDWVIERAMERARANWEEIGAVAVTQGPGLAIALGVGIHKAKQLAEKRHKPLIAVNHIEGHVLSVLAEEDKKINWPAVAVVASGGHTQVIMAESIGRYQILAESIDDNIGEALDKGARMLGLPYPGGANLEKLAKAGEAEKHRLPLPMAGREDNRFSYSGLKTAFGRLVEKIKAENGGELNERQKADLAAAYQEMVFKHFLRITKLVTEKAREERRIEDLLAGGGVIANNFLRLKIEALASELGLKTHMPKRLELCTDNAAMIGVAAGYKAQRGEFSSPEAVDRNARWKLGE